MTQGGQGQAWGRGKGREEDSIAMARKKRELTPQAARPVTSKAMKSSKPERYQEGTTTGKTMPLNRHAVRKGRLGEGKRGSFHVFDVEKKGQGRDIGVGA